MKPVVLESINFPEPVIALAIEPKTKADQEKLGRASRKLMQEDPTFKVDTDKDTGQTMISGMGELHLEIIVDRMKREFGVEANVGKPQVAYQETIRKSCQGRGQVHQADRRPGQYGHVKIELRASARRGLRVRERHHGRLDPEGVHQAHRNGHPRGAGPRHPGGLPVVDVKVSLWDGSYHEVDSSEMAFKIAGSMAFKEAAKKAQPGAARADHEGRSRDARRVHGRGHRRPVEPARPPRRPDLSGRHADHHGAGAAVEHVRLRHRPAVPHPGPRDLLDALRAVRRGSRNVSEEVVAKVMGKVEK